MVIAKSGLRTNRGVALITALFIVVLLLMVAVAVLANSSNTATNAMSVQEKNQAFDAAEAGLNVAQYQVDNNNGISAGSPVGPTTMTQNGYNYYYQIVANQIGKSSSATVSDPDAAQPNNITVPAGQAYLAGWASSILGGRTVYVEEMVVPQPPTILTPGAIVCKGNGIISHQQITDISGKHSADIHCGNITTSGGGQVPDGNSYATGTTNQVTGRDGIAHTNWSPPTFLSASQLAVIQANALANAHTPPNYYNSGNITGATTIGSAGCSVAYIAGNIDYQGNGTITNYCTTTVIMGYVKFGGNALYQVQPASTTHIAFVFGSNGAVLNGTPSANYGIIYSANGDITINGSGNGNYTGSMITPHNVTMNGGGNGVFNYNGGETPPPFTTPNVVPASQWEY